MTSSSANAATIFPTCLPYFFRAITYRRFRPPLPQADFQLLRYGPAWGICPCIPGGPPAPHRACCNSGKSVHVAQSHPQPCRFWEIASGEDPDAPELLQTSPGSRGRARNCTGSGQSCPHYSWDRVQRLSEIEQPPFHSCCGLEAFQREHILVQRSSAVRRRSSGGSQENRDC